jgi:predicted phosphodiesterase
VPFIDLLDSYQILCEWLEWKERKLWLVAGNHDLSKDSTQLSSFQFLVKLLEQQYPERVKGVYTLMQVENIVILPHLPNQDLFDAALAKVPECDVLLVHCNYDNHFCADSDHSLNMSKEQAQACKAKTILFGHEHDSRVDGKVIIPGNQFPGSVADCLAKRPKQYATIEDGEVKLHSIGLPSYVELDWRELSSTDVKFVRVVGEASSAEAAEAVTAIAKFRNSSDAFVITNAVQVYSEDRTIEFSGNLESIKAFDVLAALKEILTKEEVEAIDGLSA